MEQTFHWAAATVMNQISSDLISLLATIGPAAKNGLPILEVYAEDTTPGLREDALKAIEKIRGAKK
jgi:hypothetical protein